jgi:general transcription factor 3C polypeptide 5 (transcription factor C subunit 1)
MLSDRQVERPPLSAPQYPVSPTVLYSVEYPGYVKSTSVPLALSQMGGTRNVASAFKRPTTKQGLPLELNFRLGNPFAHPVPAYINQSHNILLKVVKRKKRNVTKSGTEEIVGEYTTEAVGVISKSARFRSILDCLTCQRT